MNSTKIKIWNKNLILLWQGSFISAFGDIVYKVALGFWVLAVTGSPGIMGAIMAVTSLPQILFSPFGGVWVDRLNRKWILIIMDIIRGGVIVLIALFALLGVLKIWMVFIVGIIIGTCAAFFNPASRSVLPDLVEKKDLEKANSFFSMIHAFSGIFGNAGGGVLFSVLGAPLLFLANGISYLISALTELFITVPKIEHKVKKPYFNDLKQGFKFVWENTGIKLLFLSLAVTNFFLGIALILLMPLFEQNESLGPTKYGIFMGAFTVGSLIGMVIIGQIKVNSKNRFIIFTLSILTMAFCFLILPLLNEFILMIVFVIIGGCFLSIVNVLTTSTLQKIIPQNMRGKVFGLLQTISGGLLPIAMAIGGLLGEFFSIKAVISGSLSIAFIISIIICTSKGIKDFFNFE